MKTFTLRDILSLKLSPVEEKGVRKSFPDKDKATLLEISKFDLHLPSKLWILTSLVSTDTLSAWVTECQQLVEFYVSQQTTDCSYFKQKLKSIKFNIKLFTNQPNHVWNARNVVSEALKSYSEWNEVSTDTALPVIIEMLSFLPDTQANKETVSTTDSLYWKDICPHCGGLAFDNGFSVDCKNKCH